MNNHAPSMLCYRAQTASAPRADSPGQLPASRPGPPLIVVARTMLFSVAAYLLSRPEPAESS